MLKKLQSGLLYSRARQLLLSFVGVCVCVCVLVGWLVSFFFNRIQHGHLAQFHEVAIQEEDRKLETTEMGSIQCKSRE